MALKNLLPPEVPLHRLLRRQEAAALLAEFENLLPRGDLALIGADGRVYAGSAEWNRAELQRLHAQGGEGQIICADGVVFQPVFVQSRYVGALVARADGGSGPLVESVLRCLHVSLTLLLNRALETRIETHVKLCRDPKDDLLLNLAISAGARYLVSADKDLIDDNLLQETMEREYEVKFVDLPRFIALLETEHPQ